MNKINKIKNKTFLSPIFNVSNMKISIDTKEDSHEEIKKVIRMLQNLVGEVQETFTNQPESSSEASVSPFANIFGDSSVPSSSPLSGTPLSPEASQETEDSSQSTDDLFAELFSEEELKKMDIKKESEDEEESEEEVKSKDKKYGIEFY